jgi:hypothetical protein
MKLLKRAGLMVRAIVVAPLRPAYQVWPEEVDIWEDFKDFNVVVLHGTKKDKLLAGIVDGTIPCDIVVINPDGLRWLFDQKKVRMPNGKYKLTVDASTRFEPLQANILFIDEASKFKNSQSDRFKLMKLVLNHFDRRYALTGSPAPKGMEDLFGVMYLVDQGESLGQFITHYRNAYFYSTGYGGYTWLLRDNAEEEILERIAPKVLTIGEEQLDLPQLVQVPIYVELPEDVMKLYKEVEDEFFGLWDGMSPIVATNAGAALSKCAQIANGGIYLGQEIDDEGKKVGKREWKDLHDAKTEAVVDYVEELLGAQCLITYDFEHDLHRLLGALGKDTPHIGGGVSVKKSKAIEDAWNGREIVNLLGQTSTVAHGLNLQKSSAQHILMHSLTFNFEDWDQLVLRLRRQGSKAKRIYLASIIARGTVDEAKMLAINKKRSGQDGLLQALKDYRKGRR